MGVGGPGYASLKIRGYLGLSVVERNLSAAEGFKKGSTGCHPERSEGSIRRYATGQSLENADGCFALLSMT
jgi:hypothetical protein